MGRFGVNFSKNPKFPKMGVSPKFPNAFRDKRWASLALGPKIIAKNYFTFSRRVGKTNFPEIRFPPPGGNQFPAKIEKWLLPKILRLKKAGLGAKKPSKHFLEKCCGSFWGDFSKKRKIPKMGVSPKFRKRFCRGRPGD